MLQMSDLPIKVVEAPHVHQLLDQDLHQEYSNVRSNNIVCYDHLFIVCIYSDI